MSSEAWRAAFWASNGFLLMPSIDHLFDRRFASFKDNGGLVVSPVADRRSLARMQMPASADIKVGFLSSGQGRFLEYHCDAVRSRLCADSGHTLRWGGADPKTKEIRCFSPYRTRLSSNPLRAQLLFAWVRRYRVPPTIQSGLELGA